MLCMKAYCTMKINFGVFDTNNNKNIYLNTDYIYLMYLVFVFGRIIPWCND